MSLKAINEIASMIHVEDFIIAYIIKYVSSQLQ